MEHLLDPLHLPEGEDREQQAAWHRAECGFLKVGIVLGNCKRASTEVCKAGNVGPQPFPVGKELDFCISVGRRSSELSWTHKCFGAMWLCLQHHFTTTQSPAAADLCHWQQREYHQLCDAHKVLSIFFMFAVFFFSVPHNADIYGDMK